MRIQHTPFALLLMVCMNMPVFAGNPTKSAGVQNQSSLLFIENKGQILDAHGNVANDVLFAVYQPSMTTFIHRDGISYQFGINQKEPSINKEIQGQLEPDEEAAMQPAIVKTFRTRMQLIGANSAASVDPGQATTYVENYYLPAYPDGITDVRSFTKITINNIYNGIDWVIYSNGNSLKYDFIVHPGADASNIKMQIDAANAVNLISDSEINIQTKLGDIQDAKLYCYTNESGTKVNASFELRNNIVSISLADFNHEETLIIDPEIVWATNYGGEGEDSVNGLDFGDDGYFYGVGYTASHAGIGYLGYDSTFNGGTLDIHILKFDTLGNKLWGTYYGGNDSDLGSNIHVPGDGYVYISGFSESWDLPTTFTAFQPFNGGGYDAVVAKFDIDGHRIWGTYFGGWTTEYGRGVKVDTATGDVYLAGSSSSFGLGYMGYDNTYQGWTDQLLVKFNNDGDRIWSTYYGGGLEDVARDVCVDQIGNVYLVGYSESSTGIYYNGWDSTLAGKHDATLAKFTANGELLWGTYYGGKKDDNGNDAEVDQNGNVFVASQMGSTGMAIDGYQMGNGGNVDMMLTKFRPNGNIEFSTYYGGLSEDEGKIVRVIGDAVYLAGYANSDGLAVNGWQEVRVDTADGLIAKFDTSGNFYWASYMGGSGVDYCRGVDGFLNQYSIYIGGKTFSSDFYTTPGAFHEDYQGGISDGYIWKVLLCEGGDVYYEDYDGDGYGNSDSWIESCSGMPAGYTTVGGDCNDSLPEINPVAIELCNLIDDDCDFVADDNVVDATISAGGPTDFCKGGSVVLHASLGPGYVYQWRKNGVNIGGATGPDYTVTKGGNFSVSVTVPGGCNDISPNTTVNVWSKPNPSITPMSDLDICATGYVKLKTTNVALHVYQWYKDGAPIGGATTNIYTATAPGSYKVKETTEHSCTKTSLPITVTSSCREGEEQTGAFQIYPNPATDKFVVKLNTESTSNDNVVIEVYNEIGELIYSTNSELNSGILVEEIILPETASNGIYLVHATTNDNVYSQQVVIAR